MSTTTVTIACAAGIVLAASGWLFYQWKLGQELHEQLRETSRFPLFAARDELVHLVAEGRVREDDDGWQSLYASVNSLLGMHQRLHAFDVAITFTRAMLAISRDPELAKEVEGYEKAETELASKVPAFARARERAHDAMMHLVKQRTKLVHEWMLLAFVVFVRVLTITVRFGVKPARRVASAAFKPSPADIKGWQVAKHAQAA